MKVYADNAATTPMTNDVIEVYSSNLRECFGNPSSIHSDGLRAADVLYKARSDIAKYLNCPRDSLIFTSGGSESNNTALLSAVLTTGKKHIITTSFEHSSVLKSARRLEEYGCELTYLNPDENGYIDPEDVLKNIRDDTALVSVMYVNNEIGTVQPIEDIARICRDKNVLFHTDAVQAVGHSPIDLSLLKADYLSASAHKFHGPKGIGFLDAANQKLLCPLILGGGQENGFRGGTENVAAAAAMSVALEGSLNNLDAKNEYIKRLSDKLIEGVLTIPGTHRNGAGEKRSPGIVNFSFDGVESEPLVMMLDVAGVECSSGSACNSKDIEPSHVIMSLYGDKKRASSSLRISLSEYNTEQEIEYTVSQIKKVISKLRAMK